VISSSRSRLSYKDRRSHQKKRFRFVGVVLLVLLIYLLFSNAVAESWMLNTDSMKPGYPSGSRVLVHPYWLRNIEGDLRRPPGRGDLVTLKPPYVEENDWYYKVLNPVVRLISFQKINIGPASREKWEDDRMFKRVIAIPGDTVRLEGSVAYVKGGDEDFFISEFEMSGIGYDLDIPVLPEGWTSDMPLSGDMDDLLLEDGQYYDLGDNRSASNDSRYWGPISVKDIRGKAFFSYWPLRSFGKPR
jgi:signal peptidase I